MPITIIPAQPDTVAEISTSNGHETVFIIAWEIDDEEGLSVRPVGVHGRVWRGDILRMRIGSKVFPYAR